MAGQAPMNSTPPEENFEFYIMRHGIAAGLGPGVTEDARRPLTLEGRKRMEEIAQGLKKLGCKFDWIVTSPLLRAVETAKILAEEQDTKAPLDFCEALRPGGSPEAVLSFLAKHPQHKRVIIIGHEPDLTEMATRLIGAGRSAHLGFKKGGCCLITFSEFPPKSPGELVWWLTPKVMRKID